MNPAPDRACLLYVDDRPISLTGRVLARRDLDLVLLRFEEAGPLPEEHLAQTARIPTFTVKLDVPLEDEAARFRIWAAGRNLRPTSFLNPSEPRQAVAHRFARAFGLPALSSQQVAWVRDKPQMKQRLVEIGLSVADHRVVRDSDELRTFGDDVGWPVVLKPVDSFACIDTYLLKSAACAQERSDLLRSGAWLAEAYVADREWECCALVSGGRVLDTYVSYMPAAPLAAIDGAINANISVGGVPADFPVDARALAQRIVDGMNLSDGYLHMEMFVGEAGQLTVSEVAFRIAGCEIPANHGLARGFDIHDAIIDIHLGRAPALDYSDERCVGDLLLPLPSGRVQRVTPLAHLLALNGVIAGRLRVNVGDAPSLQRASHLSAGFVHIEGDTIDEVERHMHAVLDRFEIETIPQGEHA